MFLTAGPTEDGAGSPGGELKGYYKSTKGKREV